MYWLWRGAQIVSWTYYGSFWYMVNTKYIAMRWEDPVSVIIIKMPPAWAPDSRNRRSILNPLRNRSMLSISVTFPSHYLPPKYLFLSTQDRCNHSALCCFPFGKLYVNFCISWSMGENINEINDGKIYKNIITYFIFFPIFYNSCANI